MNARFIIGITWIAGFYWWAWHTWTRDHPPEPSDLVAAGAVS